MNRFAFPVVAAALGLASTASAQPAPSDVTTYALVIGSNAGGPGQATLHYAEDDAKRVGSLLVELGGYAQNNVDIVLSPTPDEVRKHLDALIKKVSAENAAGHKSRVTFYYSGHARATALDLGAAELPLTELRAKLFASTALVTVVVLDACQSGAFSRVKGAEPAADFSFNSKSQLDATGVAVLASSTGSELSQESEELRGSYFTHNLLTGMRGAGDANGDGQVSIDEAYRYAYHQTLLATAQTAVGGQHVTFEVDLKGHGEVPMSFPKAATASLLLPAGFDGTTLVSNTKAKTVIAELYKAKTDTIRIAVPPGEYDVLVRQGTELSRCHVATPTTGTAKIDISRCSREKVVATATKGDDSINDSAIQARYRQASAYWRRSGLWRVDLGFAMGQDRSDDYTQKLEDFQLFKQGDQPPALELTVVRQFTFDRPLGPRIYMGGRLYYSDSAEWKRTDVLSDEAFRWRTVAGVVDVQFVIPFPSAGVLGHFALYVDGSLGLAYTGSKFTSSPDTMDSKSSSDWALGLDFDYNGGLRYQSTLLGGVGFYLGVGSSYINGLSNLDGDSHVGGGFRTHVGMSYAL